MVFKHSDAPSIAINPEPILICLINMKCMEMSGAAEFVADRKVNIIPYIQHPSTETGTAMTVVCCVTTVSDVGAR
jgi:hypothetical protein